MASVSAPLILSCRPLPAHLGLADGELAAQQRTSENICVRSRHFQNMVQLSYPAQLEPALLLVHLRHLDVYWPCLCPDFPSSRFRLFGDGSAVVMCHHTKPKCQYFMNLNKIAQTATIRDYPYDLGEDSLQTLRMLDLLTVRADVQNPLKICRGIRAAPTFAGDSGKFQLGGYMPLESCVSDTLVGFMQIPADLLLASAVLPTHEIPTFRSFEPRRSISAVLTSLNALVEGGTIHRANVDFMLEACPNCEQCWVRGTVKNHECKHI